MLENWKHGRFFLKIYFDHWFWLYVSFSQLEFVCFRERLFQCDPIIVLLIGVIQSMCEVQCCYRSVRLCTLSLWAVNYQCYKWDRIILPHCYLCDDIVWLAVMYCGDRSVPVFPRGHAHLSMMMKESGLHDSSFYTVYSAVILPHMPIGVAV